uniref:Odorant receptor n=1 Tax=Streltzoviella insularis TaxID=1206366 RepID=A0A7D5YL92_9NEOP|nr:odorant receptor 40 [Streltzoviella insularis]
MSLAGSSVAPHLRVLRRCGFCRQASTASARLRYTHTFYQLFALTVTTVYLIQEIIYSYQARNDMKMLARVMFLLLCHITSLVKQIVFYVDADRIDHLIIQFDNTMYNPEEPSRRRLLAATASSARRLQRVYSNTAILTCILWIVFPIMHRLTGRTVYFAFWTTFDYNSSTIVFVATLLYSFYVTTLVAVANTTMDAFMGTILYQCKTQLRILRMDLEILPERAYDLKKHTNEPYEKALMRLFVNSIEHYEKISETAQLLQDIFGGAILVQFGVGGWILCMTAYKIVDLSLLSIEFASMILFTICILTELFLYCFYGNEVTVESDRLMSSLYAMQWLCTPVAFRRALVLAMERAKRPLRPVAGLIIPLSLETFVTILKSSYTFYAVLRQTK